MSSRGFLIATLALVLTGLSFSCCNPAKPCHPEPEGAVEAEISAEGEGVYEGEGLLEGTVEGEGAAEGEGQSEGATEPLCTADCTYEVLHAYPHDPGAFTQGLAFDNGVLYEGTGLYRQSTLRKVDLESGAPFQMINLPDSVFGEGITVFGEHIIQLTWREKLGYVYDKNSFDLLQEFHYDTEGWGITHDGTRLIMSNGSSTLHFWDPVTFNNIGSITVRDHGAPVSKLNELEYVHGEVLANIWQSDHIARINPQTGEVTGWIHLEDLLSHADRAGADVLNGIAYDAVKDRLFVTGKLWPKLFEIRLLPMR